MNKHTPGPWVVAQEGYYPVVRHIFSPWHHMNVCGSVHGYMCAQEKFGVSEKENQSANARLIAAAPELLEALELIAETDPVDAALDPQRAVRVANAAIAKARGTE